ncbi:WD40 repeat domain-containing protein [Chloropicon primus]|uniref:WD40 repeat domain-containing protein n=2 Tax=Chloropicon primus TaxID=1764295 RepID=A0A5B8MLQ4_9CHLO|nr:WD40 repeat domain-containing protein [Chloropicon primus]UPR00154.1 WD40 repeat domain-containing protein [Chloropicon primus]|eukprot:QDZ20944.1 WD40 repeat domain-containing protein [Chloropicon primus]
MQCKICLEAAENTRVTKCGHTFCEECLSLWWLNEKAQNKQQTCPTCRRCLSNEADVFAVYDDRGSDRGKGSVAKEARDLSGGSVCHYLSDIANQFKFLERENSVLHARCAALTAEISLLRALRGPSGEGEAGEDDQCGARDGTTKNGGDSVGEGKGTSKENEDPKAKSALPAVGLPGVETASKAKALKDLKATRVYRSHQGPVHGIHVSGEGHFVATASWDCTCKIHKIHRMKGEDDGSGKVSCVSLKHDQGLYQTQFHPRSEAILATASGSLVNLWDLKTRRRTRAFDSHGDDVHDVDFSADGQRICSASADRTLMTWDIEHGKQISHLFGHESEVYGCRYISNGALASCGFDSSVRVFDPRSGKQVQNLLGHEGCVIGVDVGPNIIASGSDDRTCRLWDLRTWKPLAILHHHAGEVKRVAFSNNYQFLATASGDRSIRVYDTASLHCVRILSGHSDHVFSCSWMPGDDEIVTASHDCSWRLFQLKEAKDDGRGRNVTE